MVRGAKIVARIGPVNVYSGGYLVEKDKIEELVFSDRLKEFLNVNSNKVTEVRRFCRKYAFFPRDVSQGWQSAFKKEQETVNELVIHFNEEKLSSSDLATINAKRVGDVRKALQLVSDTKLDQIRDKIRKLNGNDDFYNEVGRNKAGHLIETTVLLSPTASLYEDVINYFKSKAQLRQCLMCKDFFVQNKYTPWQKFCSLNCKERYNKR